MIRSRRQMIAIIMKMKEKMGRAGLAGKKVSPASVRPTRTFTKTQIKLGGKSVSVHVSNKIKSKGMKDAWSSKALQKYMKAIPRSHHKDLNIRGVHVLSQGEFSNILGGSALRGTHPKALDMFIQQRKERSALSFLTPGGDLSQKAVGLHQNGRIFLNADGMEKVLTAVPGIPPWALRKGNAKQIFLHEVGHHYDGNKARYFIDAIGFRQLKTRQRYSRSMEPSMLEKLVGKSKFADEMEDVTLGSQAIEGYANLYAQYATNPLMVKMANPRGYAIMKGEFREGVPRLTKQLVPVAAVYTAGGVGAVVAARKRKKKKEKALALKKKAAR